MPKIPRSQIEHLSTRDILEYYAGAEGAFGGQGVYAVQALLARMPSEDRLKAIDGFCHHCGREGAGCPCMRDE